jgi:hypothetical protein
MAQQPRTIKFSATISHSTLSLSKLPQEPVVLILSLLLENSPGPVTIYRQDSCLEARQTRLTSSFYVLQCSTGVAPSRTSIQVNRPGPITINTDGGNISLLTLHPGIPVEAEIAIADFTASDALSSMFLCGAKLKDLNPGEKYAVKWLPGGVRAWWWKVGTKEDVVRERIPLLKRLWGSTIFEGSINENTLDERFGLEIEVEDLPEIMIES